LLPFGGFNYKDTIGSHPHGGGEGKGTFGRYSFWWF
jgi:hypothetical protein